MWCAAVGCSSSSKKKEDENKTFFSLPSNPVTKKAWINAINRTSLPKTVYLCSNHFEERCFDSTLDNQQGISDVERLKVN